MMVFWRNGYEKTSVADIVAATGASRYGLYDEFGDKHALYLAALDYYENNPIAWLLGDLEKSIEVCLETMKIDPDYIFIISKSSMDVRTRPKVHWNKPQQRQIKLLPLMRIMRILTIY